MHRHRTPEPSQLQMAMALACAYERRVFAPKEVTLLAARPSQPAHAPPHTAEHVTPPALPATAHATADVATTIGNTDAHTRRPPMCQHLLMSAEMMAHHEARLCYNCEERLTSNHRCKRLFLLISPSTNSDDGYDDSEEELGISLYALTGIHP